MFHVIVNETSTVQHVISNNNAISAKKTIFGMLAHAFVRIASI